MKKNTIITAIYFSSPLSRMGGRGYTFEHYEGPFRNILNLDSNLIIYSHAPEIDKIVAFLEKYNFKDYKIIDYDLNQFTYSEKIYLLKEKSGLINENGLTSDKHYMANDRNHHLCLNKPFFIKNAIDNNFFESENYFWVDAGLFHHGIFPESYGGIEKLTKVRDEKYWPNLKKNVANPNMFNLLFEKVIGDLILIGMDAAHGAPYWFRNFSEQNKLTHIVGGLFGGKKESVIELCNDFEKILKDVMDNDILSLEEEILSILYSKKYNKIGHLSFKNWYHDVPTDPNYFDVDENAPCFYKIFK